MRLYGDGMVVHQSQTDEGVIEVVDTGDSRSMHFGTFPRQSSMRISMPHALELSYTQAMMGCLLLNPTPRRSLVVGLGGGSVVKFLLHHFPDCQVDVIEYRQDVIDVAQSYFGVPTDNPNLNIQLGDGYLHVSRCFYDTDLSYDLLLVDAYDHNGMAASVGVQAFFDACAGIMTANGVLSINLWGSERANFNTTMQRINQSFDNRAMILPVENKGNVIALATNFDVSHAQLKQLRSKVDDWEMRYQVNLPKALQNLIRQNRNFISRLFA
ncbi:Spermidine synthase-like protein [Methylophaga thiooxydans]|uniref:Spermidine synthase-like protein n=1 Tax=Methylophaga thiooxydans TaxID=392484 RepID=A0A0A0BIC8_9GAMM|nr:spermidine synthase [Methylophaga thiooxydans]KGM06864.1 Spermidine synthase-like protein [Methylophaga thiooxydans]